jgi:hypothetical protein
MLPKKPGQSPLLQISGMHKPPGKARPATTPATAPGPVTGIDVLYMFHIAQKFKTYR